MVITLRCESSPIYIHHERSGVCILAGQQNVGAVRATPVTARLDYGGRFPSLAPYDNPQKKAFSSVNKEDESAWNTWDSYTYTMSAQVYVY